MALKDWTRLKELSAFGGLTRFENKNKSKRIYITSTGFSVESIISRNRILLSKTAKNKTSAIAFAKAYMRKN